MDSYSIPKPIWIVSFTGHRPSDGPGRDPASLHACKDSMRDVFAQLVKQASRKGGVIEVLTGCASGADIVATEVLGELGIPVHLILPMPESNFQQDFQGEHSVDWPLAKSLIKSARLGQNGNSLRIAQSDHKRPDCYHEANVQMIQTSDLLVAVYNGRPSQRSGGTAEVLQQARCLNLPIVQIDPACGGKVSWSDAAKQWPSPDPKFQELMQTCEQSGVVSLTNSTESVFNALDTEATRSGGQFRGRLMLSVYLHFLAAILAATTAAFFPVLHHTEKTFSALEKLLPKMMTGIELLLVIVALVLMIWAHVRKIHGKWLQTRFAAEITRGLCATAGLLDPLDPVVLRHAPAWRRFAVTMALDAHRNCAFSTPPPVRLEAYLEGRVAYQAERYYKKQQMRSQIWVRWLSRIGTTSAIFAPVIVGIAFAVKLESPMIPEKNHFTALFAAWLPVVLPLLAGSAAAVLVASDHARRQERYAVMFDRLDHARCMLSSLKTHGAISRLIATTEDILIGELIEWYSAAKNTGH